MIPHALLHDLVDAMRASDTHGPILLELDTAMAFALVSVIQLAARHPTARHMAMMQQVVELARVAQEGMARRDERLGRYLEQGWHEVFDVPTEEQ